jgi:hypothetical protein
MWAAYAPHRARVMSLLPRVDGGRLAILGAGNCNDVDLAELAEAFSEISLVDLDRSAIELGHERAPAPTRERIRLHELDLVDGDLDPLGAFDVVLSSCVLSQLVWTCAELLGGRSHPAFERSAREIAKAHLDRVVGLVAPGGAALLVSDTWIPRDPLPEPREPLEWSLARAEVRAECVPFTTVGFVSTEMGRHPKVAEIGFSSPWLWRIPPERTLVTYGLTASIRPLTAAPM